MAALFWFEIHTLHRLFFSGRVEPIPLTLADGEIGVCASPSPKTLKCAILLEQEKVMAKIPVRRGK